MNVEELKTRMGMCNSWLVDAANDPSPDFKHPDRVHDWRNYVPEPLQGIWSSLSFETRLVVVTLAEERADAEEWD